MRLLIILILIFNGACSNYSDEEKLIKHYEFNSEDEKITADSVEKSVTRYDDLAYKIDKHWFDQSGNLDLYTFYNRFHDTSNASFKVRFNDGNEIIELQGNPFYVSSNLLHNDTLQTDTVKAFMYLANSPFISPTVKILTKNITKDINYVIEKDQPNFLIYFEDYPDSMLQNILYSFLYKINSVSYQYKDSLDYNCYLKIEG